ncbi:uncharacterized protein TNCV_5142081 [Trichonephila clavipes]|nr:uncharacterized protein TNCV_5142081 [Trichonephila clavipes]
MISSSLDSTGLAIETSSGVARGAEGAMTPGRVTDEIRERFQQLQNLTKKYAFLRLEGILSMDELNLDQAPQDINTEEFQLERLSLQTFVAAIDPGCKKRTH